MTSVRPALEITGLLLSILAVAMLIPAGLDLALGNPDWQAFVGSAVVTLFVGGALKLCSLRPGSRTPSLGQGFLIANLVWLALALFGALPFYLAENNLGIIESLFESVSGITTTGASVMENLSELPAGILLWRVLLAWIGGISVVLLALILLPVLQVGGMQFFRLEAAAQDQEPPRATELGLGIAGLYILITLFGVAALAITGMPILDAVIHAMSAISTAGISTHQASIAHYQNWAVEAVLVVLMLCGALPFFALLQATRGHVKTLYRDSQIRLLFGFLVGATFIIALWRWLELQESTPEMLWSSLFTVASMMTGTGYRVTEIHAWGALPGAVLLFLMLIGGAAGSTSSGVKLFRVQIFATMALVHLRRLTRPHGVFVPRLSHREIPEDVSNAVLSYFILFIFAYMALTLLFGLSGLSLENALSVTASALANVGPALLDPAFARGDYSALTDGGKLIMIAGMFVGRLEILVVLVVFTLRFWRS